MLVDNPSKFADKFSVNSPRLKNWDYSTSGIYFITICTLNHNHFFGKIIDGQIELSDKGIIAKEELLKTFVIRKNIKLHEFVIMPNHIHLLMEIVNTIDNFVETPRRDVSTTSNIHKPQIAIKSWKANSISSIINQIKSISTKRIRKTRLFFAWQPRFHDEVIKDQNRFFIIKQYIKNNPKNWEKDEYNQ